MLGFFPHPPLQPLDPVPEFAHASRYCDTGLPSPLTTLSLLPHGLHVAGGSFALPLTLSYPSP